MRHQSSQYPRDCRPKRSLLALVMVLFVLPYITDIPYLEDHTSTHDAEENAKVEGKAEGDIFKIPLIVADVQNDSVVGHGLTPQDVYKRMSYPTRGVPSSQRLFSDLIISRPPPVA
jgi:hypothetical protein